MKGAILITLLFVFFSNLNKGICQSYQEGNMVKNKNIDNFTGDWIYTSGDTTFKISLRKIVLSTNKAVASRAKNNYPDILFESMVGNYELLINNKVLESTKKCKTSEFDYENNSTPIQTLNAENEYKITIIVHNKAKEYTILVVLKQLTNKTISWKVLGSPNCYGDITNNRTAEEPLINLTLPDNIILTKEN